MRLIFRAETFTHNYNTRMLLGLWYYIYYYDIWDSYIMFMQAGSSIGIHDSIKMCSIQLVTLFVCPWFYIYILKFELETFKNLVIFITAVKKAVLSRSVRWFFSVRWRSHHLWHCKMPTNYIYLFFEYNLEWYNW